MRRSVGAGKRSCFLWNWRNVCLPVKCGRGDRGQRDCCGYRPFLAELDAETRRIFVRRYFYADTIKEISDAMDISESKVKSQLFRLRGRLKKHLEKEGIEL